MKAYLISPEHKTVAAIDIESVDDIVAQVGYATLETDVITDQGDTLYFDEECFLRGASGRFQIDSLIPVSGKGVVVGVDADGGLVDAQLDLDGLNERLKFLQASSST